MQTVGVGIIGLGFMGRTHLAAYQAAAGVAASGPHKAQESRGDAAPPACRVVGVFGIAPAATSGNLATGASAELPPGTIQYKNVEALLADPSIHLVSICTPTDTHGDLVTKALRAGKHVLVEKPVALDPSAIESLAREASAAKRLCMPAMCMRFWPGWAWLKDAIGSGRYGPVVSARFERLGSRPAWSREFYLDPSRSGGALWDLHIHDADIVCWLFGAPTTVRSGGVVSTTGSINHVSTQYVFERGQGSGGPRLVTAEGGWVADAGFPFRMRYTVVFEGQRESTGGARHSGSGHEVVADWDLSRTPCLMLTQGGETRGIEIHAPSGYEGEVIAMVDAVRRGAPKSPATLEEAATVARVLRAEERSVRTGDALRV